MHKTGRRLREETRVMKSFWVLYDWSERTFWNTLTKKLMSFLLLFVVDLA